MRMLMLVVVVGCLLPCVAAQAGPATDAVRPFYAPVGFEADPGIRDRFVDPARAILDLYDRSSNDGTEIGCIDFVLAVDAQDFDQAEIDRSLEFEETVSGDTATVTALFHQFPGAPSAKKQIEWTLKRVDDVWKVSDIASGDNAWRLSAFDCR